MRRYSDSRLTLVAALAFLLLAQLPMIAPDAAVRAQEGSASSSVANVQFVIDSSGSMAEEIEPGSTRMDAAQEVMTDVIASLPDQDGVNVGLRVYGHKGSNTEAGRAESCGSSELKVPVLGVDKALLQQEVDALAPVGWTPLALSLKSAAADFPAAAAGQKNSVVLVTDGLETCFGNPCIESRNLKNGPAAITTHVIGFALSDEERANLQCIVNESGGLLLGADNADELSDALFLILDEIEVVTQTGTLEIESVSGLYPQVTVTGPLATDSDASTLPSTIQLTGTNVTELPIGTYTVSWVNQSGQSTSVDVVIEIDQRALVRGSILVLPDSSGSIYRLAALDGTVIWIGTTTAGTEVWLLPGVYRLRPEPVSADDGLLSLDVQTLPGTITSVAVTTTP